MSNGKTPLLDELEKGKWPSFVTEMKKAAKKNTLAKACSQCTDEEWELLFGEL